MQDSHTLFIGLILGKADVPSSTLGISSRKKLAKSEFFCEFLLKTH